MNESLPLRDLLPSFAGNFKRSLTTTKPDDISYRYVLGNILLETAPRFNVDLISGWGCNHEVGPHTHAGGSLLLLMVQILILRLWKSSFTHGDIHDFSSKNK